MSPERNLRVLVVDDHDVVHWGFRLLLERAALGRALPDRRERGRGAGLARRYEPHVALVDLFLGEESGAELSEAIRRESPATRVLLISGAGWISPQAAERPERRASSRRTGPADDVAEAVRMVGQGMTVFAARAEQPSALALRARARGALADVVRHDEQGDRRSLYLSPHTVKEHTSALYRKLRVRNRAEAVQRAERLGLGG